MGESENVYIIYKDKKTGEICYDSLTKKSYAKVRKNYVKQHEYDDITVLAVIVGRELYGHIYNEEIKEV